MNNILKAIQAGKEKSTQGRRKAVRSRANNPISYTSLLLLFNTVLQDVSGTEAGIIGPARSKEDTNKIQGLAKVLRNNGYTCQDVKVLLDEIVRRWTEISRDLVTLKGKKWTAMARPNLRDLAICRNDILEKLNTKKQIKKETNKENNSFTDLILNEFED